MWNVLFSLLSISYKHGMVYWKGKLIKLLSIWVIQDNTAGWLFMYHIPAADRKCTHITNIFSLFIVYLGSFANSYFKFRKRSTHVFHFYILLVFFCGQQKDRARTSSNINWIMLIEKLSKDLSVNFHPRVLTNIPKRIKPLQQCWGAFLLLLVSLSLSFLLFHLFRFARYIQMEIWTGEHFTACIN